MYWSVYDLRCSMEEHKDFEKIKKILNEHLSAINDNTGEIQVLFDYLQEVEKKMEHISQRLDKFQLSQNIPLEKPLISPLNQAEKQIFLLLYTEAMPLTIREMSQRSGFSSAVISECLTSLGSKCIPLSRNYINNQFFFSLSPEFKEAQAKENLINLSLESFM